MYPIASKTDEILFLSTNNNRELRMAGWQVSTYGYGVTILDPDTTLASRMSEAESYYQVSLKLL
jgi:hypothetical protein